MMMQLDVQNFNHSDDKTNNSKSENLLASPTNFTIISSLPSKPDELKSKTLLCNNSDEVNQLFSDTHGLKMLFANGSIEKSNFQLIDNEFSYYRLVGEAYNQNKLNRVVLNNKTKSNPINLFSNLAETKG
jgi:hypothetical protein